MWLHLLYNTARNLKSVIYVIYIKYVIYLALLSKATYSWLD